MDVGRSPLPDSINPNNFPAKLWRLVNNPANEAIFWDSQGETIVIDQRLFERQILSPGTITLINADAFKTTNFSSFVRQLNLYGFRKVDPASKDNTRRGWRRWAYHHFSNTNFKRNHPELVATLRRRTAANKAKLQAGITVNCRPPSRHQPFSGGDGVRDINVKRDSSSLLSPTQHESTHPHCLNKAQAMTAHNGTPVPPRYLIRDHDAALSPTAFATDKGIPVSLSHHYAGVASSSNAVPFQQDLLANANHENPSFVTFTPPKAQHQPGFCHPVFRCYQPNYTASHLTGSGLQTGLFSAHSFYQARYPVNMLCHRDHNQEPQHKEYQEVNRCDSNLDTIFQMADEVMQLQTSSCLVAVVTPEKPGPVLVPASITCSTVLSGNPASAMQGSPLHAGAETGFVDVVSYKQQEESVLSVPEEMPEDAIFEFPLCPGKITIDDAKDPDVIVVEVSNTAALC